MPVTIHLLWMVFSVRVFIPLIHVKYYAKYGRRVLDIPFSHSFESVSEYLHLATLTIVFVGCVRLSVISYISII